MSLTFQDRLHRLLEQAEPDAGLRSEPVRPWWLRRQRPRGACAEAGGRGHVAHLVQMAMCRGMSPSWASSYRRVKAACPRARYVGLADGAKDNWTYFDAVTERQVVDSYHVTQYLWGAAESLFAGAAGAAGMRPWFDDWCHRLKHEAGAAEALIADLEAQTVASHKERPPGAVTKALTYLRNQARGGG